MAGLLSPAMPGCDNGLGTRPMDQPLSLTTDCSHHDGPACWALCDSSHPSRPYPDLGTDFSASNVTSSPQTHLIIWMPGSTSLPGAALPAMALPLAPGLTAMLALQSIFRVIWYWSALVRWARRFSLYKTKLTNEQHGEIPQIITAQLQYELLADLYPKLEESWLFQ